MLQTGAENGRFREDRRFDREGSGNRLDMRDGRIHRRRGELANGTSVGLMCGVPLCAVHGGVDRRKHQHSNHEHKEQQPADNSFHDETQ